MIPTLKGADLQNYYSDIENNTILPFKHKIHKDALENGIHTHSYSLSKGLTDLTHSFVKNSQVQLSTFMYGVWGLLLQRYNNTDDVMFAASFMDGHDSVSVIPMRVKLADPTESIPQLLLRVEREMSDLTCADQEFMQDVLTEHGLKEMQRYDNGVLFLDDKQSHHRLTIDKINDIMNREMLDLFVVIKISEILQFDFYGKNNLDSRSIERIFEHYHQLIHNIVQADVSLPAQLEIITPEEKEMILHQFNRPAQNLKWNKPVDLLFAERAEVNPHHVALVHNGVSLTYQQLNQRANQLARLLLKKGVTRETVVAILVRPSFDMFVAILGVLKAGGAYLPIDSDYPTDRVHYILEDSKTPLVITQKTLSEQFAFTGDILYIDDCIDIEMEEQQNLDLVRDFRDLAYVIYTSGSTGRPKGVMIEHRSLVNLCEWHIDYYSVTADDRASKLAGVGFDASVWEIFPYLLSGATLHIIDEEIRIDPIKLNQYFEANQITISFLPTQLCEQFLKLNNRSLRFLLTGGDKLNQYVSNQFRLVNNYGPTENTVVSTAYQVESYMNNIPIGKPITNVQAYILDQYGHLQPIGVPGELCLSGIGLARGYLYRDDLSREKFVENPFQPGTKLYKTGDLAQWLPDGEIQFLGRIDQQVKIRGFRIELGEIEVQLLQHPFIREAVVMDRDDSRGFKYLSAYVVAEEEIDSHQLKSFLSRTLPDYMIPSYFIFMEELPLTKNGKIDRKALPDPVKLGLAIKGYMAPANSTEERLVSIWQEILGISPIGTMDNFFELGGHSLKAALLKTSILREFGVDLPVTFLFTHPTIQEIGQYIARSDQMLAKKIEKAEARKYYPLTPAQKRLFFLQQQEGIGRSYNEPYIKLIEGKLEIERLISSFHTLVQRHDALRTSFGWQDFEPIQVIQDHVEYTFHLLEQGEQSVAEIIDSFIQPFDLTRAPLFKVGLVRIAEEKHLLIFDLHHIIVDGTSMSILAKEWAALYNGASLPEKRIDYRDYAVWQNDFISTESYLSQERYWLDLFNGEIPSLNMPTDFPRPSVQNYKGAKVYFTIDQKLTRRLKELANRTGATLYMVLMAGYSILLSKYSSQEDIVVGTAIAGRNQADLEDLVGMFVNTLALRSYPQSRKKVIDYIYEVKDHLLLAFENQDYQFDALVKKLGIPRDLSRNPLFDVLFVMQNTGESELKLEQLKTSTYQYDKSTSKFDLTVEAWEKDSAIECAVEYRTDLFREESMLRFATHFITLLKNMVQDTEKSIAELEMITSEEQQLLLHDYNQTEREIDPEKTIVALFEESAASFSEKQAIFHHGESITYGQLNRRANQIARRLMESKLRSNRIVAVMLDRSIEMITAILAVMKAGAAYLPLDPEYPTERLKYMLEDSGADTLITKRNYAKKLEFAGEIIDLDQEEIDTQKDTNLGLPIRPTDLAYIIYTSGSTGRPKGVMLEHKGIVNLQSFFRERLHVNPEEHIAQFASISFDASVWEIFMSLLNGATLYIIPKEVINDYRAFEAYLNEHQITILTGPPAYITHIEPERIRTLKKLIVAGSASPIELLNKWKEKVEYVNAYGPTEATICATVWSSKDQQEDLVSSVPIGKPITNTEILILGKENQLQPIGVPGELCIAGIGLARGYLHREELTQEKFIPHPYLPNKVIYRTGDLARWLPGGNIEFLGRIDHQVKIRGFRIELGEIENQLLRHPAIQEAFVMDRKDHQGQAYLCAYIVSQEKLQVKELRDHLSKELPDYMIPSFFLFLEKMPLTPNGKVDRKALPEPDHRIGANTEYVAPRNEAEQILARVWKEVLGVEQVGIHDNFFELGGDSIKVAVLVTKLQNHFKVSINQIYENQTIAQLAEKVTLIKNEFSMKIERIKERLNNRPIADTRAIETEMDNYRKLVAPYERVDLSTKSNYRNILLTGATGYLGIHILEDLLMNYAAKIYLPIRGKSLEEAKARLKKKMEHHFESDFYSSHEERIEVILSDLSQPDFGMEPSVYLELSQKIDAIIHSAANVKHYGFYSEFHKTNVAVTQALLEFAKSRRIKDFHHISTTSVAYGKIEGRKEVVFTEFDLDLHQEIANYYAKSKYEAEKLVLGAREEGLNTNIYRIGNISFNSKNGIFQENIEENAFYSLIRAYVQLGFVPKLSPRYDISYVDYVSRAVNLLADCQNLKNETFHIYNHHLVDISEILTIEDLNLNMASMSMEDFLDRLKDCYQEENHREAIEHLLLHNGWLEEDQSQTHYLLRSDKTVKLLEKLDFEWTPPNQQLLMRMIDYCRKIQFI